MALTKLSEAVFWAVKLSSVVLVWPAAVMISFLEIKSLMTVLVKLVSFVDADWTLRDSVRDMALEAETLAAPSSRAALTALDLETMSAVALAGAPGARPLIAVSKVFRAPSMAVKAAWIVAKS